VKKLFSCLLLSLALAACSGKDHRPIVDFKASPGKNEYTYEQDLAECQQYAESISSSESAGKGAVGGAALGGSISGVVGAITGNSVGRSAAAGAAAGAIGGGAAGAGSAARSQKDIINNCMRGRGYSVLH
jgi:outer membrane lipoprotein SlyB